MVGCLYVALANQSKAKETHLRISVPCNRISTLSLSLSPLYNHLHPPADEQDGNSHERIGLLFDCAFHSIESQNVPTLRSYSDSAHPWLLHPVAVVLYRSYPKSHLTQLQKEPAPG